MNDPKILISRLQDSRWKEGRDLRLEALKVEPTAFSSSFDEEVNIPKEEWIIRNRNAFYAFDNNQLVGMIVTINQNHQMTKHIANIFGVYVKNSHRGKGFGSALFEHALRYLTEQDQLIKIKLTVNTKHSAAIGLYKKYGFSEVGIQKKEFFHEGNFYDELIMEYHI